MPTGAVIGGDLPTEFTVVAGVDVTFIQIAIALADITVPTRHRWLLWGSDASAAIGMGIAVTAVTLR